MVSDHGLGRGQTMGWGQIKVEMTHFRRRDFATSFFCSLQYSFVVFGGPHLQKGKDANPDARAHTETWAQLNGGAAKRTEK